MTDYSIRYRFSASGQADVAKAFQSIASAAAKGGAAQDKATARAEAGSAKAAAAQEKAANKAKAAADKSAAAMEKSEARKTASVEREARKRADAEIRESKRAARAQASADRQHEKMREQRNRQIGRVGGTALGLGRDAATGIIGAGAAVVGVAARREFAVRDKALALSRDTRGSGQVAVDPAMLAKEAHRTAAGTKGVVGADQVLDAMKAYTTVTGDLAGARGLQDTFAQVAAATGADANDIGALGGSLSKKFGIKGPKEMMDAMSSLVGQGKAGAFELKDASSLFPQMAAAGERFGLDKGTKGVRTLGGLAQIARESTGSAEQAGTAVEAMFRQLISKSPQLKEKGVNVFDEKGNARDIQDVLADTISKVGGNDMEAKKVGLQKIMGDEGIRAISPLIATFGEAVKNGTDPIKAMRDRMNEAINATGTEADVRMDAAQSAESAGAKLNSVLDSLAGKLGEEAGPEFDKLIETLGRSGGALDALAGTTKVLLEAFNSLAKVVGAGDAGDADKNVTKAQAALDAFDKGQKMGPKDVLSPEDQAKRDKLQADLEGAQARQVIEQKAVSGKLDDKGYAKAQADLGEMDPATIMDRVFAGGKALMLGGGNPVDAVNAMMSGPENAQQRSLREKQNAASDGETKVAVDATSLERVAVMFADAVRQIPRGDDKPGNALGL